MPKYAYLYAINNDLVGWIRVPNTAIDVQVVQAEDNDEYLKQDFLRQLQPLRLPVSRFPL